MRNKICFVVAVPMTANAFLRDHIRELKKKYDVYLAGNIINAQQIKSLEITDWQQIHIERDVSIVNDLKAVFQLKEYFQKQNFDAVHSVTPKAGLVCALAAKLAGIKHRTHIFTGQVWATRHGMMKVLLMNMDRLVAILDNHILVDGEPQRQFLIRNHIVSTSKSHVLGSGSISGVNTERFKPNDTIRHKVRSDIGIEENNFVFCFMGRQNKEKGIFELYDAFNQLLNEFSNAILLMYGSDEENCMSRLSDYKNIKPNSNFIFYGSTPEPEKYLQAADVFCMPSYREGFGTSVIEASCLGLPVICSDVYGLQDAMLDNVTGIRCKVADPKSLYSAMKRYISQPDLAKKHGQNGRERVLKFFTSEVITREWVHWYDHLFFNLN